MDISTSIIDFEKGANKMQVLIENKWLLLISLEV